MYPATNVDPSSGVMSRTVGEKEIMRISKNASPEKVVNVKTGEQRVRMSL